MCEMISSIGSFTIGARIIDIEPTLASARISLCLPLNPTLSNDIIIALRA